MSFSKFIEEYRGGQLNNVLNMQLRKLTNACQRHLRSGKLKIEILLKPKSSGEMEVSVRFEKKMPQKDTIDSIMFSNSQGDLFANDPNQMRLFDKVDGCLVDNQTGEVITPVKDLDEEQPKYQEEKND